MKLRLVEYPLKVWEINCEHVGSFRANERFCRDKEKWVIMSECLGCIEGLSELSEEEVKKILEKMRR